MTNSSFEVEIAQGSGSIDFSQDAAVLALVQDLNYYGWCLVKGATKVDPEWDLRNKGFSEHPVSA